MKAPKQFLLALLASVLFSCDCGEENIVSVCPQPEPCFVYHDVENEEKNLIRGEQLKYYSDQVCIFGITSCDEETKKITCEDIEYTKEEICDGVDNDCNGIVDDGEHLFVSFYNWQNPCRETEIGVCRHSDAICVLGEWVCIPPPTYGNEVCDGMDNDCNGVVDDNIEDTFVYTGPPETLNVGECRAGLQTCENGEEVLFGMKLPITEICGNGDDDDCDGLTDEKEEEIGPYDFALVVDFSGSMIGIISSVATALCGWSGNQDFANSRFAIIGIALEGYPSGIELISDFVTAQDACSALLNKLASQHITSGFEFQLNAIIDSFGMPNALNLNWSDRTRKIVVFSDEDPQFDSGSNPVNIIDVILTITQECVTHNTSVNVFTGWQFVSYNYWIALTNGCNGYLDYLSIYPDMMIEKLNYWFGEEC